MQVADLLEILVCVLAVYGVYAILCRILAHGCYKGDLAVALHLKRSAGGRLDRGELQDGLRRARFLTEGQRGKMLPPVILLPAAPSEEEGEIWQALRGECEVYYKLT